MRVVALTLAALAIASASAGAATTVTPVSGLRGIVTRGPITPVCIEGEPCDEPAAGVVLRFSRAGTVVAKVTTGPAGGYRVKLRPGMYTVTTPLRIGTAMTPLTAKVPRGRFARVDFSIDTGIR